ncbi:TolC family protein [Proteiniphilum sp. X52]|uniref:TolC family protein n=1 Tax=Proteiniphilum sp. X52 TaxID=2382159 RepID=UPI000F0A3D3F|nr:TolC family protein [Proteiniphilum sp. X52]RNC64225.1 TolC family protein [Proteiniphilum sp. X52]
MNRFLSILVLLFAVSTALQAQEKQWSLHNCIQYAVENSPKVNKQKAQNSIYQQDYMLAMGRLLPSLNAGTNAYFNFGRGIDPETNTYTDINTFSNTYSVHSNLTIFDGFSNIYKIKMQQANKLAGKQQLEQAREMVAYDTMESFFNVLYYKRMVQLAQEQAEESANNMKQARRMEELGMKAKPDVAEMAAKEAADIYNLTRQKNLLTIGMILLKEKMNFPVEDELDITDQQTEELIVKSGETVAAIYETAKAINPGALSAESALKVQEMNRRAAIAGFSPVISMEAGLSSRYARYLDGDNRESFSEQLKNRRGSYVGFTLSVPLFTGFSKSTSYKRSKAQVIIAESEFQETLRALYSAIEQAVADMNGQADAYQQAVKQREAMETAHETNRRKYEEGLISPLELHTSANRVIEAKAEELNAELQYRLKARLVRYYKGESFVESL